MIGTGDLASPVAVKHGNGRDWWFITGELEQPLIYTFLIDPKGIHGPFKTEMPMSYEGKELQSTNAISPDGRTYVRCNGYNGLYIFDFDRCTGRFSNLRLFPTAPKRAWFATAFAPDSKHLYLSSFTEITVMDISAPNVAATWDTLAIYDGFMDYTGASTAFWIPQLQPDGKIHYATYNTTRHLHMAHRPNLPGSSADFQQHATGLLKYNDGTMCQFPNYRLGEWEASPCDTLNGQKPGDGFEKTVYLPRKATEMEWRLLRPMHPPRLEKDLPKIPSITELAIRLSERTADTQKKTTGPRDLLQWQQVLPAAPAPLLPPSPKK